MKTKIKIIISITIVLALGLTVFLVYKNRNHYESSSEEVARLQNMFLSKQNSFEVANAYLLTLEPEEDGFVRFTKKDIDTHKAEMTIKNTMH